MVLDIKDGSIIENPRKYAAHVVEDLRNLLTATGKAQRDPNREHFFELEGITDTYYFHISPITGNVVLLARWARQAQNCYIEAGQLIA